MMNGKVKELKGAIHDIQHPRPLASQMDPETIQWVKESLERQWINLPEWSFLEAEKLIRVAKKIGLKKWADEKEKEYKGN